ncbi:reverse transcriptase domain, reverse transcriptase zinc-binding domain protein [Tanacetum coccineum]
MEKPNEDSNVSRKLNASLIKNVDGRILGKDGKPLRSAMRKPTGPNPKFGPKPIESNLNNESLAPNQDNFPVLGSDVISRVSGISNTQKPRMQDSTKDKGIHTANVNSDVFWGDSNMTNANVSGSYSESIIEEMLSRFKEMRPEEKSRPAAVTALHYEAFGGSNAPFHTHTLVLAIYWALIEISSLTELKTSLVIAIPLANKKGHTFATIDVEYEWTPPRCNTCRIFNHVTEKCPKLPKETTTSKASEEGYTEVKRKKNKKHSAKKQVEGIRLSKPNLNLQYRRVEPKTINAKTDGKKDGNQHIQSEVNLSSVGTATTSKQDINGLKLKNSYSSLDGNESDWDIDDTKLSVVNESNSEDMDEEMVMEEPIVHKNASSTGASTPDVTFS